MADEKLIKYNLFRELCLINSEDAIKTAELLEAKSVNHIAFQLLVFGLEEIGKIFIGWYQLNNTETWGKEFHNIPIDDHVKKLFWCIWGASFTNTKITKEQLGEMQNLASKLHNKRLDVMYTEFADTAPLSAKVSDDELRTYIRMARARLELAKIEGGVVTEINPTQDEDIKWFMLVTEQPEKRKFIFGNASQEKLIELGEVNQWIKWLKEHFEKEQNELRELLERELEKSKVTKSAAFKPKWKIKIKVNTPSHSIRSTVLNKFNEKSPWIKFAKGGDTQTLYIEIILDDTVKIQELWHRGWMTSNLLVAALNVGTNGIFYWHIPKDIDKFYEQIWDIENNKRLEARLETSFQLDWKSENLYFREEEIGVTFLVFRYFTSVLDTKHFVAVNYYMTALGMLAKNDMHLRLEPQCLLNFYLAFKTAVLNNEEQSEDSNIKDIGYRLLEKIILDRKEYDNVIDIAVGLEKNNGAITTQFSLTEIIGMKQYAGIYFITLAARKTHGDDSIVMTKNG